MMSISSSSSGEPLAKKACLEMKPNQTTIPKLDASGHHLNKIGLEIPSVQFGTYKMKGEECYRSVLAALRAGYRGIDTASIYENEVEVGKAIKDSGVPRSVYLSKSA